MNKSELVIGGVRAAEFTLIQVLPERYFLNGIMILNVENDNSDEPDYMDRYKMSKKDFILKYKIANLTLHGEKIVWSGYRIDVGKFDKIYLDESGDVWAERDFNYEQT